MSDPIARLMRRNLSIVGWGSMTAILILSACQAAETPAETPEEIAQRECLRAQFESGANVDAALRSCDPELYRMLDSVTLAFEGDPFLLHPTLAVWLMLAILVSCVGAVFVLNSDRDHGDDLEPEWDPSAHRLPVWATVREAAQAIAREWKALLKAVAVPALLVAVVVVLEDPFPNRSFLWDLLTGVLTFVPLTLIAVSCHRLVILGVDSLPSAWGLFWSRRETRFLGWYLLIPLITFVSLIVLSALVEILLVALLNVGLASGGHLFLLLVLLAFAGYAAARLSLVLPATSIGQRPTLKGSWRLSRSNGWRLALVMFLPSLVLIPLSVGSSQLGGIAPQFLAAFLLVLLGLIGIALLSKAFCWFTWFTAESEPSTPS